MRAVWRWKWGEAMYIQGVSLNACLRIRNTNSLFQGQSAGILSSYKRCNVRRSVSHALWITQNVYNVCVCVWYVFCWTKSIHLSHCYIVTWFTLHGYVNSHCNKSFCYENPQVVHNLLRTHLTLESGVQRLLAK